MRVKVPAADGGNPYRINRTRTGATFISRQLADGEHTRMVLGKDDLTNVCNALIDLAEQDTNP